YLPYQYLNHHRQVTPNPGHHSIFHQLHTLPYKHQPFHKPFHPLLQIPYHSLLNLPNESPNHLLKNIHGLTKRN
ncbi:peptidoglycan bridge formation glycyltransferase FemA/FemB family protein, partial [Staphylococcus epidermidis]|uniref:peptidoglycan bridge formation glycyltransferase FemA/FemB family protein n=1 Tax=Staphylococcus epidermidis TaxID=1282 RepID=UPI0011A07D21